MGTRKSKTFCEREFNQIGWKLCFEYENVHKKCIFCYSIFSIVNSQKPKMTMRAAKINNIFFNIPGVKESPIRISCFRTWIPLERREQLLLQWVDDLRWRWCWDEVDSVDNINNVDNVESKIIIVKMMLNDGDHSWADIDQVRSFAGNVFWDGCQWNIPLQKWEKYLVSFCVKLSVKHCYGFLALFPPYRNSQSV